MVPARLEKNKIRRRHPRQPPEIGRQYFRLDAKNMKIYILPIDKKFQPSRQPFRYPRHNKDYGVEQDFLKFLANNKTLLTDDPAKADWHYLPIFWTRWNLNHNFGKDNPAGFEAECNRAIIDPKKTFTICQYDDGPTVNLGETLLFLASRKTAQGIDIPLLSSRRRRPLFPPKIKYLASFVGAVGTHPLRAEMKDALAGDKRFFIFDGHAGKRFFTRETIASLVCLCPRGYGGSSFRLFEAMQLGVVPFMIGDFDTRPFRPDIDWDEFSFYTDDPKKIKDMLAAKSEAELKQMGKKAKEVYENKLAYQRWCSGVLLELEKRTLIKKIASE